MAVRLKTTEGKIKEYQTAYGIGSKFVFTENDSGGYYTPKKYVTDCGLEWGVQPNLQDQCDHLDCAIKASTRDFLFIFIFAAFCSIFSLSSFLGMENYFAGIVFGLPAYMSLAAVLKMLKESMELAEYRDNGTINGVKARQITEEPYTR
jgi:hypothetical protein